VSLAASDSGVRPGLAYQHAFDWLAVALSASDGPVACVRSGAFQARELSRRLPDLSFVNLAGRLGPGPGPADAAQPGRRAALAWAEPLAADASSFADLPHLLRPDGVLYLVVGGRLARFLAERRAQRDIHYLAEPPARRALRQAGFRVTQRRGLHGPRAILWHLAGETTRLAGRRDWRDRCYAGMRRDFAAIRGPAALVCLTAVRP
jgi:hypothetical protein